MEHRVINRAYLHDVRHHGPQLSEGPTQNRRNGGANTVFTTATTAAACSQRTRGINLMTSFESIILEPSRFDLMTSLLYDAFNRLPATCAEGGDYRGIPSIDPNSGKFCIFS